MINYKRLARELSSNVEPYILESVALTESSGNGFLKNGEPKILFEPHVFWRCLLRKKINPKNFLKGNEDILYPKYQKGKYGSLNSQHKRLQRAIAINRDCALMATSWGSFQVLGENWKDIGYKTLQAFINDAYDPTGTGQVRMFTMFIRRNNLIDELERKDFEGFTNIYNGPSGIKNGYHIKMSNYAKNLKNKIY